jgi:hypothetical protein
LVLFIPGAALSHIARRQPTGIPSFRLAAVRPAFHQSPRASSATLVLHADNGLVGGHPLQDGATIRYIRVGNLDCQRD